MDSSSICKKCGGLCCRYNNITFMTSPGSMYLEYAAVRGIRKIEVDGGFIFLDKHTCPHYNKDVGCDIYETRPKFCNIFPDKQDPANAEILIKICPLLKERKGEEINGKKGIISKEHKSRNN